MDYKQEDQQHLSLMAEISFPDEKSQSWPAEGLKKLIIDGLQRSLSEQK